MNVLYINVIILYRGTTNLKHSLPHRVRIVLVLTHDYYVLLDWKSILCIKFNIPTKGPLPDTASDFWRMVWEQSSATIVMLTNLEEEGKVHTNCLF